MKKINLNIALFLMLFVNVAWSSDKELGLLVYYSEEAKNDIGIDGVATFLNEQVEVLNSSLAETGTDVVAKIVHFELWPYENQVSLSQENETIARSIIQLVGVHPLSYSIDGIWPEKMRDYGGDVLVVIKSKFGANDSCGIGFTLSEESELDIDLANRAYVGLNITGCKPDSLAHEIGHNVGGVHTDDEPQTRTYAKGAVCNGSDTTMGIGARDRIAVFSNPDRSENGDACGDPNTADMARVIREVLPKLANKSQSVNVNQGIFGFVSTSESVEEDSGVISLSIKRDIADVEGRILLKVAGGTASNNDYSADLGVLVFEQGVDMVTVDLTVVDDTQDENEETLILSIEQITSGATIDLNANEFTLTIMASDKANNPPPIVSSPSSGGGSANFLLLLLLLLGLRSKSSYRPI